MSENRSLGNYATIFPLKEFYLLLHDIRVGREFLGCGWDRLVGRAPRLGLCPFETYELYVPNRKGEGGPKSVLMEIFTLTTFC